MHFWSSLLTSEMRNRNKILRVAKGLGLQSHLFQTLFLSAATKNQLMDWLGSFWVSPVDGDSTVSPSNSCQLLVILRVKKVFPDAQREPPMFRFVPVACDPVTGHPWKKSCLCLLCPLPSGICILWRDHPEPSLLQAGQSQHSEPFLLWGMLPSLHDLYGPLLDCLQYVPVSLVNVSCQGPGTCVCSVWWSSFPDPEVYSVTLSPFMKGTSSLLQSFNLLSASWDLQRLYFLQPASDMVKLLLNLLFYFSGNSMQ